MRLLMTTDTVGGVWSFTSELTRQLLQKGHSVHLVSFGRAPSADQQAWAAAQGDTERPHSAPDTASGEATTPFQYTASELPLEWMQNNDRVQEDGSALLEELLRQQPFDLVLSNQFCFGHLATQVPRIVVAHSDVLSWAKACSPETLEPTPWLNRYTSMVQRGLLDATALVVPTDWMGKALARNFFLPRHYLVIPNGAAVSSSPESSPERKLQAITAGRLWDRAKGLDTLTDLLSPMPLLVAGETAFDTADAPAGWPAHLRNLGLLSRADLHEAFRSSAVYLCASRYEPFGLAALEAALCGCAVVSRDLPSLREVWAENALYFSDTASLSKVLRELMENPALFAEAQRRAMGRAALFSAERMANSYLHLIENVLQLHLKNQHVA